MSMEDERYNPQVAERFKQWQQKQQQGEALYRKPIEDVARAYLEELAEIKSAVRNQVNPDFRAHPLVWIFENGKFVQTLLTENLRELLIRTRSDIVFDKKRLLLFGVSSDTPDHMSPEDEKKIGVGLCFNDGREKMNSLENIQSFQESWDRSGNEGRKVLADFGRLSKQDIIKKFENLARQNAKSDY